LITEDADSIIACGKVGTGNMASPMQHLPNVDALTRAVLTLPPLPRSWNRPPAPRNGIPEVLVFVGNAPSIPKSMDPEPFSGISNPGPALPMIDTAVKHQVAQKQNSLMSNPLESLEIHGLRMVAEERGFDVCVARNVWARCRDIETTLVVLQAMKDAANCVCAEAIGRAAIV
jgi:hypothetical protein